MRLTAKRVFMRPDSMPAGDALREHRAITGWIDAETDCRSSRYVVDRHERDLRLPGGIRIPLLAVVIRQRED
jgi:hypothetical protein